MKKIFTVLMALMLLLTFTQCKPDGGNDGDRKVKVRCEVPMNSKGVRSDFENFTTDGSIMWSLGTERLYLAIPNNGDPQIIELLADEHTMKANVLAFEGEVDEDILEQGGVYEVWYFGNSKTYGPQTYSETKSGDVIKSISGSIATQSGRLEDLGQCHIAKTTVTANYEDGEIVLPLRGKLMTEVAIAHLDLDGVTSLKGKAIIGTEYKYQYNTGSGKFEFSVTENSSASINIGNGTAASYVMLFPNAKTDVALECKKGTYTFKKEIEANKFYFRYLEDNTIAPLEWEGSGSDGGAAGTFSYNFDDGSLDGWRTFTGSGNYGNGWVISPVVPSYYPATYQTIYKGTGETNCLVSISYDMIGGSAYKPHAYIVTEESYMVSANSVLTWSVRAPYSSVGEYYEVVVSEDNSTFEAIFSETVTNSTMTAKTLNIANVAADKVGKSLYIGFRHYRASANTNASHICIDDVTLSGN